MLALLNLEKKKARVDLIAAFSNLLFRWWNQSTGNRPQAAARKILIVYKKKKMMRLSYQIQIQMQNSSWSLSFRGVSKLDEVLRKLMVF